MNNPEAFELQHNPESLVTNHIMASRMRRGPTAVALLVGISVLAAACADKGVVVSPTKTVTPEQPTATTTPKEDSPEFSPEQQVQVVERLKHVRDFTREFFREGFGNVAINPGSMGDEDYARFWAKLHPDPFHTLTWVRTGPEGKLGVIIENNYLNTGKLSQSKLSANFIDSGNGDNIRQHVPQIGEHIQGQPGYQQIPFDQLRQVVEGVFNLPRMVWQETTSTYEGGIQVPTLKGTGKTTAGSNVELTIDSFGKVFLTKTYPPPNLSFEQRFHPHKFAKNGSLKPQFAPRNLGL